MIDFSDLVEAYIKNKLEKKENISIADWLDSAAKRASQISVATHVVKFSNCDVKGTDISISPSFLAPHGYVSTNSLNKIKKDFSGNAAVMDVTGLLQLELDENSLLDVMLQNDTTPFAKFAISEKQLSDWMAGFQSVIRMQDLSSHFLAKQVYFPVGSGYHLLAPIYPSSLMHALSSRIKDSKFSEEAKKARQCQKDKEHSEIMVTNFHNLAIQQFGGTKPLNISKLNSERGGKSFLLRSSPPLWRRIEKPPRNEEIFWKDYTYHARKTIGKFQKLIKNYRLNRHYKQRLKLYIEELIFLLLGRAARIQRMPGGWSSSPDFTMELRIWLDTGCIDQISQCEDWQVKVSETFARVIEPNAIFNNLLQKKCLNLLKRMKR